MPLISLSRGRLPLSLPSSRVGHGFFSAMSSCRSSWDPSVSLRLDHPTLVLLEKCSTTDHFRQILAQMMRLHLTAQTFPMSRLLHFSAASHPELLNSALLLFRHFTPSPNLYTYNVMLSALSSSPGQAFDIYECLLWSRTFPNEQTFLSLLKASKKVSVGKQIHVHVIVSGFSSHAYLQNSLVKMYLDGGDMASARRVFDHLPEHDVVSCNIMLSGLAREGCCTGALELFGDMEASGIESDPYTIVGLLMCCGQLKNARLGKAVHGLIVRKMAVISGNLILSNALMDVYAKCGEMETAAKVFDEIVERDDISWNIIIAGYASTGEMDLARRFFDEAPRRDLISWNSLLAGYARRGDFRMVMKLLQGMLANNVRPDRVTGITLLCAAAEFGKINQGRCIHGWVLKTFAVLDVFMGSALIDMYCRCGDIGRSLILFNNVCKKDVIVWTAMITGLAFHGSGIKALELFFRMEEQALMPNKVTLVAVLTACSHAGLVDQGIEIFESMMKRYSIEPGVEHYGCVVDLLARSGRLNEALNVIAKMPMKPSRSIWGAILSASRAYSDLELAESALRELVKLEPEEEGGYVLLSNAYAASGKWSCSDKIREIMERQGVKKIGGCSSLVVDGVAHEFISADKRNHRSAEIYCTIYDLHNIMKVDEEKDFIKSSS